MKVIIAGSRTITDYHVIERAVTASGFSVDHVISGEAPGVDRVGANWAHCHDIPVTRMPADWNNNGRVAGFIRNSEMAHAGDALIAIWDGKSKGTRHMIQIMQKKGKPVYIHLVDA